MGDVQPAPSRTRDAANLRLLGRLLLLRLLLRGLLCLLLHDGQLEVDTFSTSRSKSGGDRVELADWGNLIREAT